MCCTDSARFFRQCIAHINFVPNVRFHIVLVPDLRGFKDGTSRRCWRGVSQKGGTHTIELSHYFFSNTWPLYVRMLSSCHNQYPTEYSAFVSRYIRNPIHLYRIGQNRMYRYVPVHTSTYRYIPVQDFLKSTY